MNLHTEPSWTDRLTDMFASLAMSSPVDDLQCLTWDACADAHGLASEDAARLGWHARLSDVGSGN